MTPGKKKLLIWGLVILAIAVILYFVFRKKKTIADATAASINIDAFPLKKGAQGPEVMQLQKYILSEYATDALPEFGADGKWGDETQAAIEKYLKRDSVSLDYFTKAKLNEIPVA